jgi:RNA polymerase sigma-70 factor (ECF subfamily)
MTDSDGPEQTEEVHLATAGAPSSMAGEGRPDLRAIFEAEVSYVHHSLRRMGIADRDLDDVTHDVFVTVHRKLSDYDPTRPLKPWLFGIAFRVAAMFRRKARHVREVALEEDGPMKELRDDAPEPDAVMTATETRELVIDALQKVDEEKRAVLIMHHVDGFPIPEVGRALGIPTNTAYSRLRVGREQFRTAIERLRRERGDR